jgi:hypothetical protein
VHLPKLVTASDGTTTTTAALFRLAWLANPDHLLRIEAGIVALQPILRDDPDGNGDAVVVGLEPPRLVSLRCDMLQNRDLIRTAATVASGP